MRVVKKNRKSLDFSSDAEYQYHVPVLMQEVLTHLAVHSNAHYLDVTLGGAGHTCALLDSDETIKVTGLDWDKYAVKRAVSLQKVYGNRLEVIVGNFGQLYSIAKKHAFSLFDGILADFGTSQFQINERAGFSFLHDTPLDMRMSQSHYKVTASIIVNNASEKELATLFWDYGDERRSRVIARALVKARAVKKITTTGQLAALVEQSVGGRKGQKIHPATRVFQALRIVVNKELDNIQSFLPAAFALLKPGGRLLCISFHSLEDRLIKQFFKKQEQEGVGFAVVDGIVTALPEEIARNNSSRSAKLRILEKK